MQQQGLAKCRADLPDRSTWALTRQGLASLDVTVACKVSQPAVFAHPSGDADEEWTVFAILHALNELGWSMQLLPARSSRAALPAFNPGAGEKVYYLRAKATSISKWYILALLKADKQLLDPPVEVLHLREDRYYRQVLGLDKGRRALALGDRPEEFEDMLGLQVDPMPLGVAVEELQGDAEAPASDNETEAESAAEEPGSSSSSSSSSPEANDNSDSSDSSPSSSADGSEETAAAARPAPYEGRRRARVVAPSYFWPNAAEGPCLMTWVRRASVKNNGWQATCPFHESAAGLHCTRARVIPHGAGADTPASAAVQLSLKRWLVAGAGQLSKDAHMGLADADVAAAELGERELAAAMEALPQEAVLERFRR